jgi:DNA-directed RNA polymerase specialized sigma24 family protein
MSATEGPSTSSPWSDYTQLQEDADRRKLDPKAWSADEKAEAFLDSLLVNTLRSDPNAREAWLNNLATNRAKKHRRRRALLRNYHRSHSASVPSTAHSDLERLETKERILAATTAEEWYALWAFAMGDDYKAVAAARGCSESALKSRVLRCRRRLMATCA